MSHSFYSALLCLWLCNYGFILFILQSNNKFFFFFKFHWYIISITPWRTGELECSTQGGISWEHEPAAWQRTTTHLGLGYCHWAEVSLLASEGAIIGLKTLKTPTPPLKFRKILQLLILKQLSINLQFYALHCFTKVQKCIMPLSRSKQEMTVMWGCCSACFCSASLHNAACVIGKFHRREQWLLKFPHCMHIPRHTLKISKIHECPAFRHHSACMEEICQKCSATH